jgi:hypothetical protein
MSNNALTTSPSLAAAAAPRPPVTSRPPAPTPPAAATMSELDVLRAQLAQANAEKEEANRRAAAAEAARGAPGKITALVKSKVKDTENGGEKDGKGSILIYGINSKFPASFYLQTLVKMVRAIKEDDIVRKAVLENLAHVSVRLSPNATPVRCTTEPAIAEAMQCLAELDELLGVTRE